MGLEQFNGAPTITSQWLTSRWFSCGLRKCGLLPLGATVVLPFVFSYLIVLTLIVFGGEGLDSTAQLAIAVYLVLSSLWCLSQWDGGMSFLAVSAKGIDEEVAASPHGAGLHR